MGLDMYLTASKYISAWNSDNKSELATFKKIVNASCPGASKFINQGSPSGRVEFNIGYWRKANSIHNWFVYNIQDGVDECRSYDVDIIALERLRDECRKSIESKQILLKPKAGFFFGSVEIDEWYWQDMKNTIIIIDKCIKLKDLDPAWDFKYRSSW